MDAHQAYSEPPVVEAVLAFEYSQPPGVSVRDLVHVQDRLPSTFTLYDQHHPLPSTIGGEDQNPAWPLMPRLWAYNENETLLVQLQGDRVVLNWRKRDGSPEYPGYDELRALLVDIWSRIETGHTERGLESPSPRIAEFTYFNEIRDQDGLMWTKALSPVDNHDALPGSTGLIHFHMERPLLDEGHDENVTGEIVIDARKASVSEPSILVISTRMTILAGQQPLDRLDKAHLHSRVTFEAMTTPEAHIRWGKNL